MDLTIERVGSDHPDAVRLVTHLWDEEETIYGPSGPCTFRPSDTSGPGCVFLVALDGTAAVGCCAVRPHNEPSFTVWAGEIKRVYVVPEVRGRRVGYALMQAIEAEARALSYELLVLQTGTLQPAAIRLYERCGFGRMDCWGEYAADPLSVCYEKQIGAI